MIGKIARLSAEQRSLLAEAVLALGAASFAVAVMPFRQVMARVRPPENARAGADEEAAVRAVRWAVIVGARNVPWRAKCLEQALAAHWMLRRRAVPAKLFYGVNRDTGALQAHAWVRTATRDVVGCENAADYTELASFP